MEVFIVDDEALVLDNLEYLLSEFPDVSITLRTTDVKEAFEQIGSLHPDVVFLDISMPGMTGLEFAKKLYESNLRTFVVFVTAHDHYAIDAYAYNTIDYILKPVTAVKLRRTMRKLQDTTAIGTREQKESAKTTVMAQRDDRYYPVDFKKAQYIYTSGHKVHIVVDGAEYQLKNPFQYWIETLKSQGWLRIHRSYLINLSQIETVTPMSNSIFYIKMKNSSEEIVVSRSYIVEFRENFDI